MIKLKIIEYIMFLYKEYIYEDLSVLNKLGKNLMYYINTMRILYILIFFPLTIIDFFWKKSQTYKKLENFFSLKNLQLEEYKYIIIYKK